MKRQQNLLIAIILSSIEVALSVLGALAMVAVNNDPELKSQVLTTLETQGLYTATLGMSFESFMSALTIIMVITFIYSTIKLIFIILAYRTNKPSYLITSICLTSVAVASALFIAGFIGIIYESVILLLVIFAYTTVRKNRMMMPNNTNNTNNRDKTVIDIEF